MKTFFIHPTKQDLLEANDKTVPDVIAPNLTVLFCGINPGLYTAWAGHHFARPGNRFWKALFDGGFTPRIYKPEEDRKLLQLGLGITNLVTRASAQASEISIAELETGYARLRSVVLDHTPTWLAILGIEAYRKATHQKNVTIGLQPLRIGSTGIWVLPNPSGLNAHHTPTDFGRFMFEFRIKAIKNKPYSLLAG